MGLKKRFIEMIKSGYSEFDPQNDSVEIEFEGGGDSFGSFYFVSVYPNREGELNLSDHWDTLFDVIDNSGVAYPSAVFVYRMDPTRIPSLNATIALLT
jgi:hypothetical protein